MSLETVGSGWGLRACVALFAAVGRPQWARPALLRALTANPNHIYVLATLAHLHATDGAWGAASELLQRCVAIQPEKAQGWFNLGYVHERLLQFQDAERCFRAATERAPKLDQAWYGLALALIAQERLSEAADVLRVNTQLQPMSPYGWYQLARVQADLGALDEASATIERLRQFEPKVARQLERETGLCA